MDKVACKKCGVFCQNISLSEIQRLIDGITWKVCRLFESLHSFNKAGYVFGVCSNHDPQCDRDEISKLISYRKYLKILKKSVASKFSCLCVDHYAELKGDIIGHIGKLSKVKSVQRLDPKPIQIPKISFDIVKVEEKDLDFNIVSELKSENKIAVSFSASLSESQKKFAFNAIKKAAKEGVSFESISKNNIKSVEFESELKEDKKISFGAERIISDKMIKSTVVKKLLDKGVSVQIDRGLVKFVSVKAKKDK